MKRLTSLAGIVCAQALATCVSAQVVYSHFVVPPIAAGVVSPGWELGELVTFAGGAVNLATAEFQFGALSGDGEGTLNLNLYNDSGGSPGTLITTFATPVSLVGTGPLLVTFNTGSVSLPASVWVAVRFVQTSGGIPGVIMGPNGPTVGAVSENRVFRDGGTGAWGMAAVSDWMTMQLSAGGAGCYANCDSSTSPPILNANDFQCFLNKFAAGASAANCDHSTAPPTLNANDFQCFLNAFAAGCT